MTDAIGLCDDQLEPNKLGEFSFDVRLVFTYADDHVWRSQWNRTGETAQDKASAQPMDGLAWASIEVKERLNRKIITVAQCGAESFRGFQWVAAAVLEGGKPSGQELPATTIGAKLLSDSGSVTIYRNGKAHIQEGN
jgi:hypothetical protein